MYHTKILASLSLVSLSAAVCVNPAQRRSWHTFSNEEKKEYLDAELCVMSAPVHVGLPGCRTLFDELQSNHQIQASTTHFVGAFLPYHRYLMHLHEKAMKEECGYTGHQPYWDEPLDAGNFTSSILFDTEYGFGGNGRESDGCITDGPFKDYVNSIGPGYLITDHCIDRNISNSASEGSAQAEVDACYEYDTFEDAWPCIQANPHNGGHSGVGLEMANPISSPGDPIFYLHHTWLDKVWWDWQAMDLPARLTDISGDNRQTDSSSFPSDIPGWNDGKLGNSTHTIPEFVYGDPGNQTTLTHVLSSLGVYPNATIADIMDIRGDYLCYEYV